MQKRIWLLACGFAVLIISHAQADEAPELSGDEIAARVLTITDVVLNHHIDPPTRQQMLLVGVKSLLKAAGIDPPVGLSRRISVLATDEELTGFIKDIWSTTTADSKTPLEELSKSLTDGVLQSIPGRWRLISRKEADVLDQFANNRYVGIGITLSMGEGRLRIIKVIPGGPSDRGGAKDGDMILSIDGVSTKNESLRQLIDRLRGEEGSRVKLELRARGSGKSRTLLLTRGVVPFEHVTDYREMPLRNGTSAGYLKISQISVSVLHELRKYEVQWRSGSVRAVVLDLRFVHGENIHNAVTLADGLLDGGDIGQVGTARGIKRYKAGPDCLFREWPLVLLIGPNTSGTAEWLAAALKDSGRAVLVGAPTHGQGAVNTAVPLPGTELVLTMNTGVMQRADGTPIERKQSKQRTAGQIGQVPPIQISTVDANGRRSIVTVHANGRRLIVGKPLAPQDGGVSPDHAVTVLLPRFMQEFTVAGIRLNGRRVVVNKNGRRVVVNKADPKKRAVDALTKAIEVLNGLVSVESDAKPAAQETSDDPIKASPPNGE